MTSELSYTFKIELCGIVFSSLEASKWYASKKVCGSKSQTEYSPPIWGARILTAFALPLSLWRTPWNKRCYQSKPIWIALRTKETHHTVCQTCLCYDNRTYHWGIPKPFDGLENPTANGPHCESPATVIYYSPGTELEENLRGEKTWMFNYW